MSFSRFAVKGSPKHYVDGVFMPPVEVIEQRARDVRWLVRNGFAEDFVTRIMDYDWVSVDVVRRMANVLGLEKTKRKLVEMLEEETNGLG